jgi:hypothetical protein
MQYTRADLNLQCNNQQDSRPYVYVIPQHSGTEKRIPIDTYESFALIMYRWTWHGPIRPNRQQECKYSKQKYVALLFQVPSDHTVENEGSPESQLVEISGGSICSDCVALHILYSSALAHGHRSENRQP